MSTEDYLRRQVLALRNQAAARVSLCDAEEHQPNSPLMALFRAQDVAMVVTLDAMLEMLRPRVEEPPDRKARFMGDGED